MLSEMGPAELEAPPGSAMKEEETFETLSIQECFAHARWEAKVAGLKRMRLQGQSCDDQNIQAALKLISDKSVPVQKECLETTHWLCRKVESTNNEDPLPVEPEQFIETISGWWANSCCPSIVNSGLLNQPRTKSQFLDLLEDVLYLIGDQKVLDSTLMTPLMDLYVTGAKLNTKTFKGPAIKTVANVIGVLDKALNDYGGSVLDLKLALQISSIFITHTDRALREAIYNLGVTIFKICKSMDQLTSALQDQKPIITEFTKRCEPYMTSPALKPLRQYRSKPRDRAESKGQNSIDATDNDTIENIAASSCLPVAPSWDTMDGIDLLGVQFGAENFDRRVKAIEKWDLRKSCIDDFVEPLASMNPPKLVITPGVTLNNLRILLITLNYLFEHDKNVAVQISALKAMIVLCRSVRQELSSQLLDTARVLIKSVIAKLKDKSKPLQVTCTDALNAIFTDCVQLDQFSDEIVSGMAQKNPHQRQLILQWLGNAIPSSSADSLSKCLKKFLQAAIDCANDSNESIRVASGIVILEATQFNEKLVAHAIDQVKDPKKKSTIQEVLSRAGKVLVHSPSRGGASSPLGQHEFSRGDTTGTSLQLVGTSGVSVTNLQARRDSRVDAKSDTASVITASHAGSVSNGPAIQQPPYARAKTVVNPTWVVAGSHGDIRGAGVVPALDLRGIISDINNPDWKTRKAAVQKLADAIKSQSLSESTNSAGVMQVVTQLKKAYKIETQRNVLLPMIELSGSFARMFEHKGGDCLHHCALTMIPTLIARFALERNQVVLTAVKNACKEWIRLLGVLDFSFYGGDGNNAPITTVTDLTIDKLEALYTLYEAQVRQVGNLRSELISERHPEVLFCDHLTNFCVQMFNDSANNERSIVLKRVSLYVISHIDEAAPDFWEYLLDIVERGPVSDEVYDFIHTKLNEYKSMKNSPPESVMALLPPPEGESVNSRLAQTRSWTIKSIENLRALADSWKPQVTEVLHVTMFPELNTANVDLTVAIEFWLGAVEISSSCTNLESRLGRNAEYIRIFEDDCGVVDLLCEWLVYRMCDVTSTLFIRSTAARILQDTIARLIAARYDIRSLVEQGIDVPLEIRRQEGTLSNRLIEKLFETFLDLLRQRLPDQDEEIYDLVRDVWLALTFVARDISYLYAISLVKRKRHPEVLELTAFILEQEGWVACCHLMSELTDFARFALSDHHDAMTRDLASQCLVLILLSLSRHSAKTAIKYLEDEVPGTKKFVSRYVRSHQGLLNIFPRGGVIPQDSNCFEEKCINVEEYLAKQQSLNNKTDEANGLNNTTNPTSRPDEIARESGNELAAPQSRGIVCDFDELLVKCDLDSSLKSLRSDLDDRTWQLKKQLASMRMLDWYQDIRREREGKRVGIEAELNYWNGARLIEFVQRNAQSDSSYIILEAKRLLQSDMAQLREASKVLLGIHAQNVKMHEKSVSDTSSGPIEEGDWMVPYTVDLISGCYSALRTVFQVEKFSDPQFMPTAELVSELTFEVCRSRKVLYQASPGLLCSMFMAALISMGQHKYWDEIAGSKSVVEKMNSIMGLHLLGRVSPRTAACVLECFYEYAIPMNYTLGEICNYDCNPPSYIDPDLFLRVSRRFVRKLNMKHPQVTEINSDSLYPLTANDRLNYTRILDSALTCLLLVEVCVPLPTKSEDLRYALLQCLRELLASLFIYTPALVGIYLRDKKFKSCFSEINERLEVFSAQAPAHMRNSSVACLYVEPQMTKNRFMSFCLERLMNEGVPDTHDVSYIYLHKAYLANGQSSKLSLPEDKYPNFSIDEFIDRAPATVSLQTLDATTASGWDKKRDLLYQADSVSGRNDVVPVDQLKDNWLQRLGRLCGGACKVLDDGLGNPIAVSPGKCGAEKLTSLSMRFRSFYS